MVLYTANNLAPIEHGDAVTPSDTVDFTNGQCRALYVGVSGDVTMILDGSTVLFKAMAVGWHWVRPTRIKATGTTATTILACY